MTKEAKEKIKIGAPYSKEYLRKIFLSASIVAGVGLLGSANLVYAETVAEPTGIVESVERESISIFSTPSDQTEDSGKSSEKEISIFNEKPAPALEEQNQAENQRKEEKKVANKKETASKKESSSSQGRPASRQSRQASPRQRVEARPASPTPTRPRPASPSLSRPASFNLQEANIARIASPMAGNQLMQVASNEPNYAKDEKNRRDLQRNPIGER